MAVLAGSDAPPRMADYATECASYRVTVPTRFNAVRDIVERWGNDDPDALALLTIDGKGCEQSRQSAAELAHLARRGAQALLDLGVAKGDRLLIMLPRSVEWYVVMLGAMRIGAVPMPAPNLSTAKDIAFRLDSGGAVGMITDAAGAAKISLAAVPACVIHRLCVVPGAVATGWRSFSELIEHAPGHPLPDDPTSSDDPLLVYFTSGTVGPPKMVEHTQSYALGHIGTARFWHDLRSGDRHWTVSDTGWAKAAWGGLFGQWHERAAVVQVALGKPDAALILHILAEHGITSFCAPPTLYRQ